MPDIVDVTAVSEQKFLDGVELMWRIQSANVTGTTLYLVSSRSCIGRHFREHDASAWRVIKQASVIPACSVDGGLEKYFI